MPISLLPSRRSFLAQAAAGAAAISMARPASAASKVDGEHFVFFSDTHVPNAPDVESRGVRMAKNLQIAVDGVLAGTKPDAVFVNGDCAYLDGKPEDYAQLAELIEPLRRAEIPIHLLLGNHDHRENCWKTFEPKLGQDQSVENKHVLVVETPKANWFLLDSLDVVNESHGQLGRSQLTWLAKELDARPDKPALISIHHNPMRNDTRFLRDTQELYDVLASRKQVKAYFFGHTHVWGVSEFQGIHLVNLPPVAYVFFPGLPSGWVDVQLNETGMLLKLTSIDPTHSQHGQSMQLSWRT